MNAAEACSSQLGIGHWPAPRVCPEAGGKKVVMRLGLFLIQPLIRGTEGRRKGAGNWRWVRAEGAFPYLAQRVHGDEGRGTGRVLKRERWAILTVIGGCQGTSVYPKIIAITGYLCSFLYQNHWCTVGFLCSPMSYDRSIQCFPRGLGATTSERACHGSC